MKNVENQSQVLLEIKDLRVLFQGRKKLLPAVDGVNLSIRQGEIVGVVGESGSGKSVMSQTILRLREHESEVQYEGSILFDGQDILKLPLASMSKIRGNQISVIFQDPLTSLNPVYTVGNQMSEVLMLHKKMSKQEAREKSIELLNLTGIPSPERCIKQYPFELSGGMQQRVMIAMALACEPKLLIADEPTTALDVTIQEQILDLIVELNKKLGMSVLFITHDLSAMAQLCHSVRVMYLGQIVEEAATAELFACPSHPYTRGLLSCIPRLDTDREEELPVIPGVVPPLTDVPVGCHFCTRCTLADEKCREEEPPVTEVTPGHKVKCWKYGQTEKEKEAVQ
ncbi:ABC transporter ATP-binding protein [Hespellia stercorisuis]|uniref:Peptide/nickel transport system ATP-binding protein n=1 Tax=Hespellia stercorisuis DSM 15480 TaxID=1121950 RepID=A0A1M6TG01_9FIRM|nr:ABC transporter ATP-binding protein [Hespellia stercorisuis]SHK55945.1 peptide/nickel transport system ATP-binding protein [Hespellia stercorisuis DSM 15480]